MASEKTTPGVQIEVQKFALPDMLSRTEATTSEGDIAWPLNPLALCLLYQHSPEHSRAIHVKAEACYGGGLTGEGADTLDDLFDTGATDAFVDLGVDLECYGNAYIQRIISADGSLAGLRRLPAVTMTRRLNGFAQKTTPPGTSTPRRTLFSKEEIIHLRVPCPAGLAYAYPSWIGAQGMLELAREAVRYNAAFFRNNAMPEYAIVTKGTQLNAAQKSAVQDFFRRDYHGTDNSHRTIYIHLSEAEGSIEFEKLTGDGKDGDFLKLIDAARDRIPIAHGTPPRVLGIASGGQLGGGGELTGQLFMFENHTCLPRRRRMLSQFAPVLKELGINRNQIAFRPMDLTPPGDDTPHLADLVAAQILTVEEARNGLPMLQDGERRAAENGQQPVERTAPTDRADMLIKALERL